MKMHILIYLKLRGYLTKMAIFCPILKQLEAFSNDNITFEMGNKVEALAIK
jgi:hypothetical protein